MSKCVSVQSRHTFEHHLRPFLSSRRLSPSREMSRKWAGPRAPPRHVGRNSWSSPPLPRPNASLSCCLAGASFHSRHWRFFSLLLVLRFLDFAFFPLFSVLYVSWFSFLFPLFLVFTFFDFHLFSSFSFLYVPRLSFIFHLFLFFTFLKFHLFLLSFFSLLSSFFISFFFSLRFLICIILFLLRFSSLSHKFRDNTDL